MGMQQRGVLQERERLLSIWKNWNSFSRYYCFEGNGGMKYFYSLIYYAILCFNMYFMVKRINRLHVSLEKIEFLKAIGKC